RTSKQTGVPTTVLGNVSLMPSPSVSVAVRGKQPSGAEPSSIARNALMNFVASTPPGLLGSFEATAVTSKIVPTLMAEIAVTMLSPRPTPLRIWKFNRQLPEGPVGARPPPPARVQHCPAPHEPLNAEGSTWLSVASERSFS